MHKQVNNRKRNYVKEAADDAVSFLVDGYRIIGEVQDRATATWKIFLYHPRSGRRLRVCANDCGFSVYCNGKLVKQEP